MKKIFTIGGVKMSVNKKGDEVRVQIGKEIRVIKALELWGVAFSFTQDPEIRAKLMPVQAKEIMKFKKVHTVQLKKDMKAGETLQFSCIIDVPTYVIEGMRKIIEEEVPGSKEVLKELIPSPFALSTGEAEQD